MQSTNQWLNCSIGSIKQKIRKAANDNFSETVWEWFESVRARNQWYRNMLQK